MALNIPAQEAYGVPSMEPGISPALLGGVSGAPQPGGWRGLLGQLNHNGFGNADLAYALLANSGPSPTPRSFGQIVGTSLQQAQAAQIQRQSLGLDNSYKRAQIEHLNNPPRKPVPIVGADGKIRYSDEEGAIGKEVGMLNPGGNTTGDIQRWNLYAQQERAAGRQPLEFNAWHEQWLAQQPVNPQVVTAGGGVKVVQPTRSGGISGSTDISSPAQETTFASNKAKAQADAEKMSARNAAYVETGVHAADSVAVLKRSIELLDSVETGGLDNAKLSLTNLLGITGADEAELSANTGKAILAQLRPTFGAQFTKAEGDRLKDIEAGFGKSSAANKRLLRQALQIAKRAAERGYDAAKALDDPVSASAIERSMNFSLSPPEPGAK